MKKTLLILVAACMTAFAWGQVTAPYAEDFEGGVVGTTPSGWSTAASTTPSVTANPEYVWGIFAVDGNQMIYINNYECREGVAAINTPAITLPTGQTSSFTFDYSHRANCGDFKVKISTDNGATFTDLKTYAQASSGYNYETPGTWNSENINLAAYAGQTIVIQFWTEANWWNGAIFVDNVFIGPVVSCYAPSLSAVQNITATSASINWTASGHGESEYQYLCVAAGNDANWAAATTTTATSATFSGLTPNTLYTIYVRSHCGDGDESVAVNRSFRTDCAAVTPEQLGLVGFETADGFMAGAGNMANCWTVGNQQSDDADYIPFVKAGSDEAYRGTNCLHIKAYQSPTVNADKAYAILPTMTFGDITKYKMQFFMRKVDAIVGGMDSNDTLLVGIMPNLDESLTGLQIVGRVLNTNTTYAKADVSFENYTGGKEGYVVLLARVDTKAYLTTRCADFYVDNVIVKVNNGCETPGAIYYSNVTTSQVNLSWEGEAANHRVLVATEKVENPNSYTNWVKSVDVAGTSTVLTGLTPATRYYIYVQAVCSGDVLSDVSESYVVFTTECNAISSLPWREGFESETAGFVPVCWNGIVFKGYLEVQNTAMNAHTGSNSLYFYGGDEFYGKTLIVFPEFNVDLNGKMLSFWSKQSGAGTAHAALEVGTITDPNDSTTFTVMTTIGKSKTYEQYDIELTVPAGSRLAFRLPRGQEAAEDADRPVALFIDDIVISEKPACAKPSNLTLGTVTAETAVLSWSGAASNYSVEVKTADEVLFDNNVNAKTITLTGLTPATTYNLSVNIVALCSAESASDTLQKTTTFTTECKAVSEFAWREDFEAIAATKLPSCWDNSECSESLSASQRWVCYVDGDNHCARFNSNLVADGDTALLISPELILPAVAKDLMFDWKNPAGGDFSAYVWPTDGKRVLLKSGMTSQATWKQEVFSLAAYAGKSIRLVFKGTSNYGSSKAFIYLDNVDVRDVDEMPTAITTPTVETNSNQAVKVLIEGVIYIKRNGELYDLRGIRVRDPRLK